MSEQFLATPSLPKETVSCVVVSHRKPTVIRSLHAHGVRTIITRRLSNISGAEAFHPDMSFCDVGGGMVFAAAQTDETTRRLLRKEGVQLTLTAAPVLAALPLLNVLILQNHVICHPPSTDPKLLAYLEDRGYEIITTRQRYARCSAAVVSDRAVITADTSIDRVCRLHGIEVLKIRPGHILLDGYDYGFIGGCCGLLAPDCLAFSGNLSLHPDDASIRAFAKNHGVEVLCLSEEPLYDIGGIIPLKVVISS